MSPNFWWIFGSALLLSAGATPFLGKIGRLTGVVDRPSARKLHSVPMPLLGGIAIWGAVLGALVAHRARPEILQAGTILVGATWVSFWGFVDDWRELRVSWKLLVQLIAALVLLSSGVDVRLPVPAWVNVVLTLLWVLGVTNAFNLLDNMDGLCAGTGAVAAATFLALAAANGQYLVGSLAAALLGACLGFLVWNINPARIFMGDSGSLFIGFLVAAIGIKLRFPQNVPTVTWIVPVLVVGVGVFDTIFVCVSRLRRGVNPLTTPGTDHVSHHFLRRGWSARRVLALFAGAGGVLGAAAFAVSVSRAGVAYAIGAAALLAGVAALVLLQRRLPESQD